jgi:hypothetical protein
MKKCFFVLQTVLMVIAVYLGCLIANKLQSFNHWGENSTNVMGFAAGIGLMAVIIILTQKSKP